MLERSNARERSAPRLEPFLVIICLRLELAVNKIGSRSYRGGLIMFGTDDNY